MAKRGRKPKNPNVFESINPELTREIFGVILAIVAIILILAEFNAAGKLGATLFSQIKSFFGATAYVVTFWIGFSAIYVLAPDFMRRSKAILWGSLIFLVLFSALIAPFGSSGGVVGNSLFSAVQSLTGQFLAIVIFLGLCLAALIFTFNFSIVSFIKSARMKAEQGYTGLNVREGGVSVFRTVRRRIGMGDDRKKREEGVPVMTTPDGTWEFPSTELLEESTGKAQPGNLAKNAEIIIKCLADFGIDASPGTINVGPTVTQYELKPAEGVKINNIVSRSDDLALTLAAHPVRIEAPIPGKSAVGIEVPNKVVARVALRDLLESETFKKRSSNLTLPLGLDVSGHVILADLKKMPHMLVAGATGSGKSVGLNSVLLSLLFQNSPKDLRVLLVDPKRVEFTSYNGIPHLLTPVVVEVEKTVNLLRWAIAEMDRRFKLFEQVGSRDIESYNGKNGNSNQGGEGRSQELPYIVIVIDELADLMAQAANEVEAAIVRLAQLARATGIHLVIATQRPSVDVLTGLIKANITSRVAFAVASQVDSRVIIDQAGAEKLLGNGDMLFLGGEYNKPKRVQGAFISEHDVKNVTDFLKRHGSAVYDNSITEYHEVAGIKSRGTGTAGGFSSGSDPLLEEAKNLVVDSGRASASFLQRRLEVGYARAARLLDLMEEEGIIGPGRGAKPRDILVGSIDKRNYDRERFEEEGEDRPRFGRYR
ncbi:MAG: DNA translocase FtsK [Candidatus Berkelbacteria bacterium]|nr:DNA translocase FtsK [Candidatus Berkelbacteria bacterium]